MTSPALFLVAFREGLHRCLPRRADALFELADAVLSGSPASSPVHLSLEAVHRRGWCNLYAALRRGRVDEEAARDLLAAHLPDEPGDHPRVFAVDVSVWPRCDAECSPKLFVFDAGYDPVKLQSGLGGCSAQLLVRPHSGRVFYARPETLQQRPVGQPFVHGKKFGPF